MILMVREWLLGVITLTKIEVTVVCGQHPELDTPLRATRGSEHPSSLACVYEGRWCQVSTVSVMVSLQCNP
jgi:hypothetical protein